MSPRKKEQNEMLRESRRLQILDAALTVYVRLGYHGTDMDIVAAHAGLAKGLMYYYFKTKKDLFSVMFEWMTEKTIKTSQDFMDAHSSTSPVERLVHYTWDIFGLSHKDPRVIQFAMRMPFDAYAVFGPEEWKEGLKRSRSHEEMLVSIIEQGIDAGEIPPVNAQSAANCFWSVFVSNLFSFTKMTGNINTQENPAGRDDTLGKVHDIVRFCFQGLGIDNGLWEKYLEEIISN
jgi:Transcriptional regulator